MNLDFVKLELELAKKCWSIRDLARNANVGTATLYKIANHKGSPSTKTLGKIAKALDVQVTELLKNHGG